VPHGVWQPQLRNERGYAWGAKRHGLSSHIDHIGTKTTGPDLAADTLPCFADDGPTAVALQVVRGCQARHSGTDDCHCFAHRLRVRTFWHQSKSGVGTRNNLRNGNLIVGDFLRRGRFRLELDLSASRIELRNT